VRTIHGSCLAEAANIPGIKSKFYMLFLAFLETLSCIVADKTVAVSSNTCRSYPWIRTVIPNGVDLRAFTPAAGVRKNAEFRIENQEGMANDGGVHHKDTKTRRDGGIHKEVAEVAEEGGEGRRATEITEITEGTRGQGERGCSERITGLAGQGAGSGIDGNGGIHKEVAEVMEGGDGRRIEQRTTNNEQRGSGIDGDGGSHKEVAEVTEGGIVQRIPVRRETTDGEDKTATKADVPTILFVGTYGNRKRGKLLMEIFARDILPKLPAAQLWMVCSDAP
jgi:glycosyltransferase involved in cell wall biosynthesis